MTVLKPFITILTHPQNKGKFWKALGTVLWWKVNQIFFQLPAIVEIAPNVKIICYPNNSYGSFIVYALWPEYHELNFIYSILRENDNYIDVGAHIGDSSLLAASKIKTGKVISCEPTPAIFNELYTNIKLNNFENIIYPLQKAISDREGVAFFTLETASEVNHLGSKVNGKKSIKVLTTTVDTLVTQNSLKKVELLKIDVEGFELEVMLGAKKSLHLNKVGMILFEVNPTVADISDRVDKVQKFLDTYAFSYYEFTGKGLLEEVSELYVTPRTSNFLAVSKTSKKSAKFKKWLK